MSTSLSVKDRRKRVENVSFYQWQKYLKYTRGVVCYGFEIGKRGSAELLFLCVRQGVVMGYGLWVIGYGLLGGKFQVSNL